MLLLLLLLLLLLYIDSTVFYQKLCLRCRWFVSLLNNTAARHAARAVCWRRRLSERLEFTVTALQFVRGCLMSHRRGFQGEFFYRMSDFQKMSGRELKACCVLY